MKDVNSKNPFVVLIILNWNGEKIIKNCLSSLLKTDYPNYKVIVVDNGSVDNSVDIIKKYFKEKVELIINKENLGFPKGMNLGIKYAIKKYNPNYIGLLNNDLIFFDRDWLSRIIKVMENDNSIGVASPLLLFPDKSIQRVGEIFSNNLALLMIRMLTAVPKKIHKTNLKGVMKVDILFGPCLIIKREVLEKIGLLDERYSPFLFEDVEYSFRLKKFGYKIVAVFDSKVIHLLSYSMGKLSKENVEKDLFRFYVTMRNAFLFSVEYFGFIRSFFFSLPIIIFVTFFEKKKKRDAISMMNLSIRWYTGKRVCYLLKSLIDAIRLMRKSKSRLIQNDQYFI